MNSMNTGPVIKLSPRVQIPRKEILARLGYRRAKTEISNEEENRIDGDMMQAYSLCDFSAYYCRVQITEKTDNCLILQNGQKIESADFAKFCGNSMLLLVMAATAGKMISAAIAELSSSMAMSKAVVYDALASECADAALDWTQRYCAGQFTRSGESVSTRRYSPGYGDLDVRTQRIFFDLLELGTHGFTITDSSLLIPEKSVIGIAVIE